MTNVKRVVVVFSIALTVGCGTTTEPGSDASTDAQATRDQGSADGSAAADLGPANVDSGPPACVDGDGDGARDSACGGTDCDDTNPLAYPGGTERCDLVDNDCNPATLGPDEDRDGTPATACCNPQPTGMLLCGTDCNDARDAVKPGATEVCNEVDDDCNGQLDDGPGVKTTFYRDLDGDGAGNPLSTVDGCSAPGGYVLVGGDCNDMSRAINPATPEVCNNLDDDCDGMTDNLANGMPCSCTDGARRSCGTPDGMGGFSMVGQCRVGEQLCTGGAFTPCAGATLASEELCDSVDNDCDGATDEGVSVQCYTDNDNDTFAPGTAVAQRKCLDPTRVAWGSCPFGYTATRPVAGATDCNDESIGTNPLIVERCNTVDDNCNGMIDEPPGAAPTCYVDADRDTYPVSSTGAVMTMCSCGPGYTARAPTRFTTDCDDTRMDVNPGATELCDGPGADENCNRSSNENCGCNGTESGACAEPGVCGATGMRACNGMGMWGACSVQPTTEVCTPTTFADGDCNGLDDVQQGLTVSCYDDPDGDGYSGAGVVAQPRCPQSGACPPLTTARAPDPGLVDCAPADPNVAPGRSEQRCDGVDDNCNGTIDDDNVRTTAYVDGDRDGVTSALTTRVCAADISATNGLFAAQSPTVDCDDSNMNVFPGQARYFGTPRYCRTANSPFAMVCTCGDPGCNYRNFDYNCDNNNDDRQGGSPCTGLVCPNTGYYTSPQPCGTTSQFQFCTAGATCTNGMIRSFNQPCR